MADTGTVALITGGALVLSQGLNIIYNLWSQKQKDRFEIRKNSLVKRIEVGENFFHTIRESVININRQVEIGKVKNNIQSPENLEYINYQVEIIKKSSEKLLAETSKFNLAELYFDIESETSVLTKDLSEIFSNTAFLFELDYKMQFLENEAWTKANDEYIERYDKHQIYLPV